MANSFGIHVIDADGSVKTTSAGGGGGSGTVTNTGTLTANQVVIGNGTVDIKVLGTLGTTTTVLHGNAAGAPTFGAVSLTADVTGDLPFSNIAQASGASKLLGRGDSGAGDFQEITLGTNLTMTGTTLSATGGAGSGTVTNTGTLTANQLIIGNGGVDVSALGTLGTTTTVLHGNAGGAPTFTAVSLTADVTGDLPFASFVQASAASKIVGRGSASGAGDFEELSPDQNSIVVSSTSLIGQLYFQETTLDHTQISNLNGTPITVVSAQGSGIAAQPVFVTMSADCSAGAYNNPTIRFRYTGDTTDLFTGSSGTLNTTTKRTQAQPALAVGISTSVTDNVAIQISASIAVTGGNAANRYRVRMYYTKLSVL